MMGVDDIQHFTWLIFIFFIQEDSISNQLDFGIRFLDLRIAHKIKDPDKVFYFAHGIYSLLTVKVWLMGILEECQFLIPSQK